MITLGVKFGKIQNNEGVGLSQKWNQLLKLPFSPLVKLVWSRTSCRGFCKMVADLTDLLLHIVGSEIENQ